MWKKSPGKPFENQLQDLLSMPYQRSRFRRSTFMQIPRALCARKNSSWGLRRGSFRASISTTLTASYHGFNATVRALFAACPSLGTAVSLLNPGVGRVFAPLASSSRVLVAQFPSFLLSLLVFFYQRITL